MPRLSNEERGWALGYLEAGVSISRVARMFHVTRRTLYMLTETFNLTGTTQDRPRMGRPRVTTHAEDRIRCRRRVNEQCLLPTYVQEAANRGYGEVMVWAGITTVQILFLCLVT